MHFSKMTATRVTLVAAMVGLGVVAAAVPAQAALTTSCVGTARNVTVPGDLVVPAGKSCDLKNVVVNGQTTVRSDANLVTTGSTFNGAVTVRDNGYLDLYKTSVAKSVTLSTAYGAYFENSTLRGSVTTGGGFVYSIGSSHTGRVVSTNGETYVESGWLHQSLTTTGDSYTDLTDTVINGKLAVADAKGGSVICTSEIDGNTTITGAGTDGLVQIGPSEAITDCGFNVFAANVALRNNHVPVTFNGNVIRGNLSCTGNDPKPTGSDNRVRGTSSGQCMHLSPTPAAVAPAAKAQTASPHDRANTVLAKIAQRSKAAIDAATAAGSAAIGR
ncbi:MAG: hypothetical protein ACR2P2_09360 [Nakamurella sp.]